MEKTYLGSVYINHAVRPASTSYYGHDGGDITIGDSEPGYQLPVIPYKDVFVAATVIAPGAPWSTLDKLGFITGRVVIIDGKPYRCRSLKLGPDKTSKSEWDEILEAVGDGDAWDNNLCSFWGQETASGAPDCRVYAGGVGGNNLSHRGFGSADFSFPGVGFRPVLEPLHCVPKVEDHMIGKQITVYGADGSVTGVLADFNDYDLSFVQATAPDGRKWAEQIGEGVVADRNAVIWLEEKE